MDKVSTGKQPPSPQSSAQTGGGHNGATIFSGTRPRVRPLFTGQRLVVFTWQLDNLARMLGQHAEGFDLHAWCFAADALLVQSPLVSDDWWPWFQGETYREAIRRGLPVCQPGVKVVPFTVQELKDARQLRQAWGGCRHTPPCLTMAGCEGVMIRQWRWERDHGV